MRTYRLDTVLIIRSVISFNTHRRTSRGRHFEFETRVEGLKQCAQGELRILNMACTFASAYPWEN